MFGDQGFVERGDTIFYGNLFYITEPLGNNASFSRSREVSQVERLNGILTIPQEWHKKKVRFVNTSIRLPSRNVEANNSL